LILSQWPVTFSASSSEVLMPSYCSRMKLSWRQALVRISATASHGCYAARGERGLGLLIVLERRVLRFVLGLAGGDMVLWIVDRNSALFNRDRHLSVCGL
jgi:hypothetical protein